MVALAPSVARAEASHSVYIPISIHTESEVIRSSACLEVEEQVNSQPAAKLDTGFAAADRSFDAVISAMKRKDHDALLRLADPKLGRDPKQFDLQASAYFQQFEKIDLVGVTRVYRLDGLVIYLAKLQLDGKPIFSPFAFTYNEEGVAGFLPYNTDLVTDELVEGWLRAKWGPASTANPTYCDGPTVARANHRVALASAAEGQKQGSHLSYLLLDGTSFDNPGRLKDSTLQVEEAVGAIDSALAGDRMEEFLALLPPVAAKRARETLVSAKGDERERFTAAITEQKPFFMFDASPLFVVYTKAPTGLIRVMYFTFNAQHRLVWTNSSLATSADRVFKRGPLFEAASLKVPFASMAIK